MKDTADHKNSRIKQREEKIKNKIDTKKNKRLVCLVFSHLPPSLSFWSQGIPN